MFGIERLRELAKNQADKAIANNIMEYYASRANAANALKAQRIPTNIKKPKPTIVDKFFEVLAVEEVNRLEKLAVTAWTNYTIQAKP